MAAPEYSIALKRLDGSWGKVGADLAPGIVAENITHSGELPGGPSRLSFVLKRDTRVPWPDLTPFTPVYATVGGIRAWSGRVTSTPTARGASSEITVNCEGWWQHLADNPVDKAWVITDASRFVPTLSMANINPAAYTQSARCEVGSGGILFGLSRNDYLETNHAMGSVTLDLGPNALAKRVLFDYTTTAYGTASTLYCRGHDTPDPLNATATASSDAYTLTGSFSTSYSNVGGTFATPRRYVSFFLYFTGAGAAAAAENAMNIKNIRIFTDTAYESGNASIVKASTIIGEALAAGADSDVFSTSTANITTTTFSIPEFYTPGRMTVQDIATAANAYHSYQIYTTPDPTPSLVYRAVPTAPTYVLNESDGYEFQNASANDSSEVFNQVRLSYTQGDGTPAEAIVSAEPYMQTVMADAPVSYWRMDDSYASLRDYTGYAHGTLFNTPTLGVAGALGGSSNTAMTFTRASSEYAGMPYRPSLHPGDTFTVELWFKRTGTIGTQQTLYSNTTTNDLTIYFNSSNKLLCDKYASSTIFTSTASFTDTSWHHFVWSKSGSTNAFYLDGAVLAGSTSNATIVGSATATTQIGMDNATAYFDGSIDEVAFYNTALSATQVAAHYNAATKADTTFPGRRNFVRTQDIEVRSKLPPSAAVQIANTYLASATSAPLKGTLRVTGTIQRYADGARVPVGTLQAGDVILLGNEQTPETGARGRKGQIAAINYTHDTLTADITLDSRKNYLDALLARRG